MGRSQGSLDGEMRFPFWAGHWPAFETGNDEIAAAGR
jgi:hypothetical protein